MDVQVFGAPAEFRAVAQEVSRDGGTVLVKLTPPGDAPQGTPWRLRFAEPVSVAAGETVIIETGWPAVDAAPPIMPPSPLGGARAWTMSCDASVNAVSG